MKTLKNIIPIIRDNLDQIITLRTLKHKKEDESYVSKGDLLVDKLIADFVDQNYTNYILVSEEKYGGEYIPVNQFDYVIVVDPIDGTENFVSGLKEWGIGISVYIQNEHHESMIALPELDEYIMTGHQFERFDSRIAGLSSSLNKHHLMDLVEGYEYRITGCCMYNMLQVIKGSFKTFQNPKGAHSWDILPGLNLAIENNLEVLIDNKKYNGEFLQPIQKYRFSIRNV
jgi:myo-inositol-1(or 4)-monophosphatase